jgi:hypothetical protein
MSRVIVSFTTIPSRVNALPFMLESLVGQTRRLEAVYLNVASMTAKGVPYNFKELEAILSPFQDQLPLFINHVSYPDVGPIMKLAPVLDLEQDPQTLIILVDDDTIYSPNVVDTLVAGFSTHQTAVGFAGRVANDFVSSLLLSQSVDFLETYHGCLYPRFLFPKTTNKFIRWCQRGPWSQDRDCFWTDDIVLGFWVRSQKKKLWVLPSYEISVHHDARGGEELRTLNLSGRNVGCMAALEACERRSATISMIRASLICLALLFVLLCLICVTCA